ncbi:hypothetical protein JL107_17565 [Nakamurella flavida]|uniref:DUF4267 domain-containing protein n=1 Tax=Nakamurella flavida TaxID=363630 RepID=A0A939C6M3_9ACTN|nr:hypothetical protein [Nakamurella flavida]MBM9478259.1 hypothetical protein [Nakamurella flavida]MDP9777570.1 hypothetical protein [Nakamurella flavida]
MPNTSTGYTTLTRSFGVLSAALGVAPAVVPGAVARLIGATPRLRNRVLLRSIGARELAVSAGLFVAPSPAMLWARVAGDAMDVPLALVSAVGATGSRRGRAWATVGVVTAIAVADVVAAIRPPSDGTPSPITLVNATPATPPSYNAAQQPAGKTPTAGVPNKPEG